MYDTLVTADWHIGNLSDSFVDKNGLEFKINETFKMIDQMIKHAIKNKFKYFIIDGDMYNGKRPLPLYEQMVIERLNLLDINKIRTFIIKGNHEHSKTSDSALAPLAKIRYKYIHVIERMTNYKTEEGLKFIFLPHSDKDIDVNRLNKIINSPGRNIIFGHLHFQGAKVGSEQTMLRGGINFFPDIDSKKVDKVYLGHIHGFQIIRWKSTDVAYPGSIVRCNFGERKEPKGFIVHGIERNKWDFIENKTIQYKMVRINLVDKDYVDLDKVKIEKSVGGKIVKLLIEVSEDNRKKLNLDSIEKAFSKFGHVTKREIKIIKENMKEISFTSFNPVKVFDKYIDKNYKKNKTFADRIKNLGHKIIEKVEEQNE